MNIKTFPSISIEIAVHKSVGKMMNFSKKSVELEF